VAQTGHKRGPRKIFAGAGRIDLRTMARPPNLRKARFARAFHAIESGNQDGNDFQHISMFYQNQ
jgi:hypothetical protein